MKTTSAKKGKILILGYFGYFNNQIDGQTIKTREIYNIIKKNSGSNTIIDQFDTQAFKKNKIFILKMLVAIFKSKQIVYMPGRNNFKFFFPIVYILCRILKKDLLYIVVGGWLHDFVQPLKLHRKLLRSLRIILVESENLKKDLMHSYYLDNVETIPNFRIYNFTPEITARKKKFKIVFMSRITKPKGIHTIFRFANWIREHKPTLDLCIDFYGPIHKPEEVSFHQKLQDYDFVQYKGIVNPEEVYRTLSKYDVIVLPTFYDGEGFPGAIIDAYISGIPVIVSRWKQLPEFVDHGSTGYIFNLDDEDAFFTYILNLYNDDTLLLSMKKKAYEKSKMYSEEKAWKILKEYL